MAGPSEGAFATDTVQCLDGWSGVDKDSDPPGGPCSPCGSVGWSGTSLGIL